MGREEEVKESSFRIWKWDLNEVKDLAMRQRERERELQISKHSMRETSAISMGCLLSGNFSELWSGCAHTMHLDTGCVCFQSGLPSSANVYWTVSKYLWRACRAQEHLLSAEPWIMSFKDFQKIGFCGLREIFQRNYKLIWKTLRPPSRSTVHPRYCI